MVFFNCVVCRYKYKLEKNSNGFGKVTEQQIIKRNIYKEKMKRFWASKNKMVEKVHRENKNNKN